MKNVTLTICVMILAVCVFDTGSAQSVEQSWGNNLWNSSDLFEPTAFVTKYNKDGTKRPWGTGFFLDIYPHTKYVYFITNRHLVVGQDSIEVSFSILSENEEKKQIVRDGLMLVLRLRKPTVLYPNHPDSDFAAIPFVRPRDTINFKPIKLTQTVDFADINFGEEVLFLGYPLPEDMLHRFKLPIYRKGLVAYILYEANTALGTISGSILLDGVSDSGNSGGPVFSNRPYISTTLSGRYQAVQHDRRLIGIVMGHISKTKLVAGDKTDENFDLVKAISIETIIDYVRANNKVDTTHVR